MLDLKEDILKMLEGKRVFVQTATFKNDLSSIRTKDEALTALIHLGYLGYDASTEEAFIPNFEVSLAFQSALADGAQPALVIELKWEQSADAAIKQIKERRYAGNLKGFAGEVLLVGISYDKEDRNKKHHCMIEKMMMD